MTDRNQKLVDAAAAVFSRYGIGKTTMNDIAQEAGVSRQTLYNAFPNKEAVLRAVVRQKSLEALEAVVTAWAQQSDLSEQLESFFVLGPLAWYDIVQASPDLAEILDGVNAIAEDEMKDLARQFTSEIANLIRSHVPEGSAHHRDADGIADFIYSTSKSAKVSAPDRNKLVSRLQVLKAAILALVTP